MFNDNGSVEFRKCYCKTGFLRADSNEPLRMILNVRCTVGWPDMKKYLTIKEMVYTHNCSIFRALGSRIILHS
jgi:hypothetical protein